MSKHPTVIIIDDAPESYDLCCYLHGITQNSNFEIDLQHSQSIVLELTSYSNTTNVNLELLKKIEPALQQLCRSKSEVWWRAISCRFAYHNIWCLSPRVFPRRSGWSL
jgi:hypothetical protein